MRFGFVVLLSLCLASVVGLVGSSGSTEAQQNSLEEEFRAASEEYGVPVEVLKAMGYVNTRWEMPPPQASNYEDGAGRDAGNTEARGNYGIMSLYQNPSKDSLGRAAELTGLSEEELKTSRAANIRGGAVVLAEIQGDQKPEDLNGWYDAVAKYGATDKDDTNLLYANQVYKTLKKGATAEISTGERVTLEAQPEAEPRQLFTGQASGDYGHSTWYGAYHNGGNDPGCYDQANYCKKNRGAPQIDKVVIHVTQGSWSSAINWFKDSRAGTSAHYTVRSSDGKIGQSVREDDIAYHAGNWNYNTRSIGIEHEGYVSEPRWFTNAMYRSSARLTAYLCKKYRIKINRNNIIGHNEVPGATHTDPGRHWDWGKYMNLVKSYAGSSSGSSSYRQVVDNASNRFRASRAWKVSSWSSQKYGKNYRYTTPRRVKDTAKFKVKVPKRAKYNVYARWPANSGYNSRTVFLVRTTDGWKRRVVNQRRNGGRWVRLGTYTMPAGDRAWVRIARASSGKGHVIADAVMIKKA